MSTTDVVARLSVRDRAGFQRDMQGAQGDVEGLGSSAEGAGNKGAGAMGILKLGVLAAGAAAVTAGVALFKIGQDFQEASNTIRVGTGATGDALALLNENAMNIATTVPASFGDAATAVADLNTRLGLTGPALEAMSGQFLELSRITGTDVATNIADMSRLFGDWGVEADAMPGTMDAIFRAAQATGVEIGQLSNQMVTYGAPMRQLGFTFEEGAALLANFEKQGVNAELVMGSMRQALGRMAREGEPAVETFQRVTEAIAAAGSTGEANAMALELFGARAGPDMAAAIREGRFEVGALMDSIANGSDTIMAAGEDTRGFSEQWMIFKNQMLVAVAPAATAVFNALGRGMTWLQENGPAMVDKVRPFIDLIVEAWPKIREGAEAMWTRLQPIIAAWQDAFDAITVAAGRFWDAFGADIITYLSGAWDRVSAIFNGALEVIQGVYEIIAALFRGDWSALWDGVLRVFSGVWEVITSVFGLGLDAIKAGLRVFTAPFKAAWEGFTGGISRVWSSAWGGLRDAASSGWSTMSGWLDGAKGELSSAWGGFTASLSSMWSGVWGAVGPTFATLWEPVQGMIDGAVATVQAVWEAFTSALSGDWEGAWDSINGVIDGARQWITEKFSEITTAVTTWWSDLTRVFTEVMMAVPGFERVWTALRDTVVGVWDRIRTAAATAWQWIQDNVLGPMERGFDRLRDATSWIPGVGGGSDADTFASSAGPPVMSARAGAFVTAPVRVTQLMSAAAGGSTPVTVNFAVTAVDDESVRRFFADHRRTIAEEVQVAVGRARVTA